MGLQALTESEAAVTLDEAKDHLRIELDFTGHDATLTTLVLAATEYIEGATRTQLVSRDYLLTLDSFPQDRELKLPRVPLASVASVKYLDPSGVQQTFNAALYVVDAGAKPGRIVLKPGGSWPATSGEASGIEVRFTAGYGTDEDVPQILKQAVLLMVGHWFENREGAIDRRIDTVPLAVESLITMHFFPECV